MNRLTAADNLSAAIEAIIQAGDAELARRLVPELDRIRALLLGYPLEIRLEEPEHSRRGG